MTSNAAIPSDEDTGIVRITGELCEMLKVDFGLNAIRWMASGERLRVPSDQVDFVDSGIMSGSVVLPLALRGRLELAEWRPLLAPALFIQRRPEMRRIWTNLWRLLKASVYIAILAVPILFIRFLVVEFGQTIGMLAFAIEFLSLFVALVILGRLVFRFYALHVVGGLRLKADRESSRIVGKEQLIQTLKKIDALRIPDLEERKLEKRSIWKRGPVSSWPTIAERLENLQGNSPR